MLSHTVWSLQSLQALFCSFDSSLPCLESISEDKHGRNHKSRQPAQSAAPSGYPAEPQEEKKVNLGGPDVSLVYSLLLQRCLEQDWERFLSRVASLSGKWAMNNQNNNNNKKDLDAETRTVPGCCCFYLVAKGQKTCNLKHVLICFRTRKSNIKAPAWPL